MVKRSRIGCALKMKLQLFALFDVGCVSRVRHYLVRFEGDA